MFIETREQIEKRIVLSNILIECIKDDDILMKHEKRREIDAERRVIKRLEQVLSAGPTKIHMTPRGRYGSHLEEYFYFAQETVKAW